MERGYPGPGLDLLGRRRRGSEGAAEAEETPLGREGGVVEAELGRLRRRRGRRLTRGRRRVVGDAGDRHEEEEEDEHHVEHEQGVEEDGFHPAARTSRRTPRS